MSPFGFAFIMVSRNTIKHITMKKSIGLWSLLCLPLLLTAQLEDVHNYDYVYQENIRSVQFHLDGLLLTYPIIDLNSSATLALSFDDLDADVKDYTYQLIHCDRDWQPSQLNTMDYIQGFPEELVDNFQYSFKTVTPFTHYRLYLPNNDMRWTISGNYLLVVYEDEGDKKPVITRRFVVVDPQVNIQPRLVRPSKVSKSRTHHEIDFIVDHERLDIRSPQIEVRAAVLQNGRWDNAVVDLKPFFVRNNELVFDYQDVIVFPAMKEYRYLDLRSLRFRSENIAAIESYRDGYEVILYKDEKRANQSFFNREDINGRFIIETYDENDFDLSSDYADVMFTLYSPAELDGDVYLFGAVSDWLPREKFKMTYNPAVNGYVVKALLKQGYYEYAYGVMPSVEGAQKLDTSETEGNSYETQNNYSIILYYRPFGSRYDQVIGAVTFDSNP